MENDPEQIDMNEILSESENPARLGEELKKEMETWKSKNLNTEKVSESLFTAEQLEKIRWGLEKGVDADIYSFPEIPAVEMEIVRQMLVMLQADRLDTQKNINVIRRFVCLCVAEKKNISTAIAKEITTGIQKRLEVEKYADPSFSYRQMLQIRQGLEKGINVSSYCSASTTEAEMRRIRLELEKNKESLNVKVAKNEVEKKAATSDQVDPKLTERESEPVQRDVPKLENTNYTIPQLMQIFLGQRASVPVSKYASLNFKAEQMHEVRLGLENGINVSFYCMPEALTAKEMRLVRLCMMSGFQPTTSGAAVVAETKKFQMIAVARRYQYKDSIFRDFLFDGEQAEEICRGRKNGLHAELVLLVNPSFSSAQMREIRLGLEKGVDAESYSLADYSSAQMREIRLGLEKLLSHRQRVSRSFFQLLKRKKGEKQC